MEISRRKKVTKFFLGICLIMQHDITNAATGWLPSIPSPIAWIMRGKAGDLVSAPAVAVGSSVQSNVAAAVLLERSWSEKLLDRCSQGCIVGGGSAAILGAYAHSIALLGPGGGALFLGFMLQSGHADKIVKAISALQAQMHGRFDETRDRLNAIEQQGKSLAQQENVHHAEAMQELGQLKDGQGKLQKDVSTLVSGTEEIQGRLKELGANVHGIRGDIDTKVSVQLKAIIEQQARCDQLIKDGNMEHVRVFQEALKKQKEELNDMIQQHGASMSSQMKIAVELALSNKFEEMFAKVLQDSERTRQAVVQEGRITREAYDAGVATIIQALESQTPGGLCGGLVKKKLKKKKRQKAGLQVGGGRLPRSESDPNGVGGLPRVNIAEVLSVISKPSKPAPVLAPLSVQGMVYSMALTRTADAQS